MQRLFFILMIAVSLLLISCDRFDHEYDEINFATELYNPMATAFENSSADDLTAVMAFYQDDYMHNAVNKAQREEFFHSLYVLYGDDIVLTPVFSSYSDGQQSVSWELQVTEAAGSREVLAVIPFTDEKIVKIGNSWKFYGNRVTDIEQGTKQRVIFESFTFTTCPNCPAVEEVMHGLQTQYPSQFSYIEYHISDQLTIPANMAAYMYYGISPMPMTIFQGQEKRLASNPETLDAYVAYVQGMLSNTPEIVLDNYNGSIQDNVLHGSVQLQNNGGTINPENLKLKYTVLDKVSTTTNALGNPCTNVVLAAGSQDLSMAELNGNVSFELAVPSNLPSDAVVIIYVQNMPPVFANNAKIYNGIEVPVLSSIN